MAKVEEHELSLWLRRLRDNVPEAFHEVYVRINPYVYRTVYFLMYNKNDVEDVVNEVYIAMFQALPSYNANKPFRAWLNGLIIRQTSNWKRKVWRTMRLGLRLTSFWAMESQGPDRPDEQLSRIEDQHEMLSRLDKLSMKLREVVVMRYYGECSYEEMADILGIPVGTVKSRHHSAIRRLRGLTGSDSHEGGVSVRVR